MAGNRTLKLSILADVDNLKKGLNQADNDVSGFGSKLEGFAKTAGIAFAAAGAAAVAYAGKLAIDGVKAAIEDEAAQIKLATSLQNVTKATDEQIKATEDYILKTSLAYGVTDDDLRPSLDRLVRSTKDVTEAQKLQNLALDIAAGTGKSLQAVSEALAKAHDGNVGALKRLGIQTQETIYVTKDNTAAKQAAERAELNYQLAVDKFGVTSAQAQRAHLALEQATERVGNATTSAKKVTLDFDTIVQNLSTTFQGQASKQADTFEGKLRILQIAFDEGKETIGSFILDAITPMLDSIVNRVIPAIRSFIDGIGGANGLKSVFNNYIDAAKNIFIPIFEGIKDAFDKIKNAVMNNKEEFVALFKFLKDFVAPLLGGALKLAIEAIGTALSVVIETIGFFTSAIEKAYNAIKKLIDFIKNNPLSKFLSSGFSGASFTSANLITESGGFEFTGGAGLGGGGGVTATPAQQARMDELKAETARLRQDTATIRERIAARARGDIFGSSPVTVNMGVVGDPEAAARTIVDVLNRSSTRGTLGAEGLF